MDLWQLSDLSTPWCLHVVATLRIPHHMAAGITSSEGLAHAAAADRDALDRVLRHLARKGVFEQTGPGRFALNETSRQLLNEGICKGLDLDSIGGRMANSWSTLLQVVRTGRPSVAFWDDLERHPEVAADFDALMGSMGHGTPDPQVLLDPDDWSQVRTVVDVGGGSGALLAEILRAHPDVRGILVDLPRTVARSAAVFDAAGVADRVIVAGQSFFDPLPGGGDLYLLKSVLSDWPDAEATAILRRCAEAAKPGGRVIALSGVTPEETADPELLMLVLVGGKQRTLAEFGALAQAAGLNVRASGRQKSGRFLVECVPGSTT